MIQDGLGPSVRAARLSLQVELGTRTTRERKERARTDRGFFDRAVLVGEWGVSMYFARVEGGGWRASRRCENFSASALELIPAAGRVGQLVPLRRLQRLAKAGRVSRWPVPSRGGHASRAQTEARRSLMPYAGPPSVGLTISAALPRRQPCGPAADANTLQDGRRRPKAHHRSPASAARGSDCERRTINIQYLHTLPSVFYTQL
ncbi:hypothetical protein BDZ91DRAFT_813529 [Kalaharituber pfeilii]|nr:hypothetical protein BDZ91DRAFT_813529 [Kalaharituber pfeilii]